MNFAGDSKGSKCQLPPGHFVVQGHYKIGKGMANSCVIESEGWQEVKQIEALNASRPDSMDAMFYHKYWSIIVFYHKYWSIIGKTIYLMIKAFLHHGHLLKELNNTHSYFDFEKDNPQKVSDYRPIGLCMYLINLFLKFWQIIFVWFF